MTEKILLVDDDLDTLKLVGLMLQRQGYQILAANSGLQALSMAEKESPNLILLDVMMPEMDGYEVTRRLRANPQTTHIPIIMFTAKGQVEEKIMGFESGADDYLTKPTQPKELFAHMKAVLTRTKKTPHAIETRIKYEKERGLVIGIVAAKGGLGVSTIAINLGIAIRQLSEKSVIVTDFRPGQGTIGLDLGYTRSESLNHLLQKNATEISPIDVERELINHQSGIRLLLSSHRPLDGKCINLTDHFKVITEHLSRSAQTLVIDMGNCLAPYIEHIANLIDHLIIVVEPSPNNLIHSKVLVENLISSGIGEGRIKFVMVNKARSGIQLTLSQVQDQLGQPVLVVFTPAPELAYQSSISGNPIVLLQPDSITTQQFTQLAEKLARPMDLL